MSDKKNRNPWAWVPTLYFAEGLPYVAVMTVSAIMFKKFGMSNSDITVYTSWLNLPWVFKFLWSPFVDLLKTKRWWIITMQFFIGAGLGAVALSLPTPYWFQLSMAFFFLLAFSSATHDIAADGFYMLGLNDKNQAFFVGIRNTFYRLAMISGEGLLIILAGSMETTALPKFAKFMGNITFSWTITFLTMGLCFIILGVYHTFILPRPAIDVSNPQRQTKEIFQEFGLTFVSFFKKKNIVLAVAFLLFYRFSEAQLQKIMPLFLLDSIKNGGLGLSTLTYGTIKGVVGTTALILGGIIGGIVIAKDGLHKWIWPMVLCMSLPNLISIYFAYVQPESLWLVNAGVAFEQFGYGFGFTAYTLFMLQLCKGEHQTAHYAFCTAFMALSMMLPGFFAGEIQEALGYQHFFIWVMICALVPFLLVALIRPKLERK
jgi:MFS transporter, PAT family, beta-lactamase induction signal transducer AmpG